LLWFAGAGSFINVKMFSFTVEGSDAYFVYVAIGRRCQNLERS